MKSRALITGIIGFCAATTFAAQGGSGEWPQWRGPNRDGVSTEKGLLKDWPAGGPMLAWKTTGLGEGFSTIAIAGGKIFTIGDKADASYAIAMNLADGKQLWASKVGKMGAPGWGGFAG